MKYKAPDMRPGNELLGSGGKHRSISRSNHTCFPDSPQGSAPHCPRVPGPGLLDTVIFGLLCDPRCALYSLWSGSLSSHNQAEPGPTETPALAPQLQLNLLNLTSQANFTPWPESGAFPRLGRVAPALTGPWGQKGGTGPEVLVPR